ncbi:MAG TPA: ATP-binding protein [Acidimicrobiia bacterium]|nr:ATP-binding protein [Acidimicrobiia bacterium]
MTETDEVVLRFPARPEYLRLGRLAAADVASRAGFDYEEIEDLRIAVSEMCAMLSSDDGAELTLTFRVEADAVTVGGSSPHARSEATEDLALAQALVAAVVDEHDLSTDGDVSTFRLVKRRAGTTRP